jgi:type IV secretion system protein VirB11
VALSSEVESYLDLYLDPLGPYLSRADVTDIYVNRPGELWIETLGGHIERFDAPELSEAHLWRLARQVASSSNQGFTKSHPLLTATLPNEARIQIVGSPACPHGVAIAIRRHIVKTPSLESYAFAQVRALEQQLTEAAASRDHAAFLAQAVRARKNIVVAGGTSSGKTTLLNALLTHVSASERLILIEDAPELRVAPPNNVRMVAIRGRHGEADVTTGDLLQAALRMRPDRIIIGELRGPEAFTFLRAINTGHPGSMTTIHADNPRSALVQLAMMSVQAGLSLSFDDALTLTRNMVDVVVQVARDQGARSISDIYVVSHSGSRH